MNRMMFRITLGLSACIVLFAISMSPAEAQWWDNDFGYRSAIELGPMPDNYQVRITLDNSSGNIMQDNFQDIRFVDNDGEGDATAGPLDYWIENYDETGETCIVHVRVVENADNTIYWYYGSASVADNSNVVGVWGYDAGFDDNTGWTEADPGTFFEIANDNSRLEWVGIGSDNAFVYAENPALPEWRLDYTYRIKDPPGLSVHIVAGVEDSSHAPTELKSSWDSNYASIYSSGNNIHSWYNEDATYSLADTLEDVSNGITYYMTLTKTNEAGTWTGTTKGWTNEAREGTPVIDGTIAGGPSTAMGRIYPISGWNGGETGERTGWTDSVMFRKHINTEPSFAVGTEQMPDHITVSTPTLDNNLVDRDQDYVGSGAVTATQISVQIIQNSLGDNADSLTNDVYLFIRDASNNVVIDNVGPTDNTLIDENTIEYNFAPYNPLDNTADGDLGIFEVYIAALDNSGRQDTWGYTDLFTVTDLVDNAPTQENFSKHRHRIQDNAGRPDHGVVTLTSASIVDNNNGTIACVVSGAGYENLYTPSDNGDVYAIFAATSLDGSSDVLSYMYPNLPPGIVSSSADNVLIDNHASDNAITATLIEFVFQDNDGFGDFSGNYYVALRDAANVLVDNRLVSSITLENENYVVLRITYDAEDNNLADAAMGNWDVWSAARDDWSGINGWRDAVFDVNDMVIPVVFTPTNPYAGFDLTVSGTSSLRSGVAAVDNHRIVDSVHGTFWQAAGNAYSENYDITISAPSAVVPITVTGWNGVLDGQTSTSYTVSDNQLFQIIVRFEENYGLVDWIHDENRPVTVEFLWDGGSLEDTLDGNPDNFNIGTGENLVHTIQITDNGLYWRRNIIDVYGGEIVMIIVGDYGTVGGTAIDDVDQFTFFLQDMTALYEPPGGIMSFRRWIGENLAIVNEDFWGADWKMVSWLITGSRYQLWMEATDAPLRLIGPIDAVNAVEEKTIQVTAFVSEVIEIYEDIYWAAYRVSDNVIRVEYQDNTDNTTSSYVAINNYRGTLLQAYQPDNSWFVITYSLASPDEGYSVDVQFTHATYGQFDMSVPIASGGPPDIGGISNQFGLPDGVTLAALGSLVLMFVMALAFDSTRVPFGMLAMAMVPVFCWTMGWLTLPGPFNGAFTATMFILAAVLVILAWRRGS